jgi:L-ascorbate metabolism protein UlaG (beta-lactamase superfamily)
MKITFLGTGAADWNASEHGSWDGFRRNYSALIDDCLLIDPGPDVPEALATFGKSTEKIRWIINTHLHSDHFCKDTLSYLSGADFVSLAAGETKEVGPYTISAYSANHGTCKEAVHFIVTDGEKRLFYGLDGAWLLYDEVEAIKASGVDLAVLDATIGDVPGDYRIFEHNNLNMVRDMKRTLDPYIKRLCISHMARTLHGTQSEIEAAVRLQGIEVAYDGYETEL